MDGTAVGAAAPAAETTAQSQAQATQNTQPAESAKEQKPTSRQRLTERYRKSRPDLNFDDANADIDYEGLAADELDAFDKDRSARADMDEKMNKLFNSDSRAAKVFVDWANGRDPIENLLEAYGDDFTEALQSPEGKEKFKQALEKWRTGKKADAEHEKAYNANIDESARTLIKFADNKGIDDDVLKSIVEKAHSLSSEVADGKFSEEFLEMIYKADNYDKAVSEAREEGRVTGKNENIRKEIRKSKPSNGLPAPGGAQGAVSGEGAPSKAKPKTIDFLGGIPVGNKN